MATFKSKAHREHLRKLTAEGKFPQQDFDALTAASQSLDLPERATPARGKDPVRLSTGGSTQYTRGRRSRSPTLY